MKTSFHHRVVKESGQDWSSCRSLLELHEKARRASLSPYEQARYSAAMKRLVQVANAGQNAGLKQGQVPRQTPRIPRALQLELLSSRGERQKTVTLDLGLGGFLALLPTGAAHRESLTAVLHLRHREQVKAGVRVVGAQARRGTARVSFAFENMSEADSLRLEAFIADDLVRRFAV